ncbi:MAG: carbon-nitrogen hydrolase family protein [Peptoniphilus sp.]|nr:carbon-nitrogen hydrolase family protein [Peptoniphilus sp.]MDD7362847.1 carbon-nitrogen hydrolase family protein [Bacillota bacterium]MDY6043961.1 carbon-nitrogen hydrolase family protein [Peptoniphilus sp.]
MKDLKKTCRVAVCQAAPVMFDKDACVEKAIRLIEEAADHGAELIVIPELFIPGYPLGMNFGFSVGKRTQPGREDWKIYYDNSILADGKEMDRLTECVKARRVYLSIGYSERDAVSATLYNSNMMLSPDGRRLNHRKLKPTGSERNIWGEAYRDYFPVMDTPWGPVGDMICWESYMPLARVALYEKGITIYISSNTNDNAEWQNTVRHIAIEGRCYVVNADLYFTKAMYPTMNEGSKIDAKTACRGGSNVIDPFGHAVTETLWDREGIVYGDLDMDEVPASRMEFDVCGHYSREDIFRFEFEDK